jgi:hypothetical protein
LQLAALKEKLAVVLRKTKNDDRLITALRAELATAVSGGGGGGHALRASVTGVDVAEGAGQELAWTEVAQLRQQVRGRPCVLLVNDGGCLCAAPSSVKEAGEGCQT